MGWSELPSELVIKIASNLTEFTDHLRFRSVCSHWRSSFHSHTLRLPPQLPLLAFSSTSSTHLYSLSEDRVYSNVSNNCKLFGSFSGWFLSVSVTNTFFLINPFTGALIALPSPDPCWSLSYAAADSLVWDYSDSIVMSACRTKPGVFYYRLGEPAWALTEFEQYHIASSITFDEGRFYILRFDTFETVVLDGETLEEITVINPPYFGILPVEVHLFVSSGELLLLSNLTMMYQCGDCYLHFYMVQRTNLNGELVQWINIYDVGDRALFLDNLHCFSVKVGDNCLLKRNCVYSVQSNTGQDSSKMYSIAIFDIRNRNGVCLEGALSKFCAADSPPSWVLLSLNGGLVLDRNPKNK